MENPAKKGRPPFEPSEKDRNQVTLMAGFGLTEEQIARVLKITSPTLRKHYRLELANGHIEANVRVMNNLFRQATKDDVRAFPCIKFWLNCRAGWSEYAPAPVALSPEKLGKKEQAAAESETAAEGTEWSNYVH